MKIYWTLIFSLVLSLSSAQTQKGDWLIKGNGASIQASRLTASSSNTNFDLALGYFINRRWVAGAGISLNLSEFSTYVTNEVFGRYYFRDSLNRNRFYLESRWEIGKYSPIGVGQSSRRTTLNSGILGIGGDYFLSEQLAIELQLDYYYLNILKRFGELSRARVDFLTFDVKLQYFFRYRDYQKERLIDYRDVLQKGNWFLGGRMSIREYDQARLLFIQNIRPLAGKFLKKNWAVGSELIYASTLRYQTIILGLGPFSRYYINLGRKKKAFVQLQGSYQWIFSDSGQGKYRTNNYLTYGAAIGWSNFITKEVSFDILYSFSKEQSYDIGFKDGGQVLTVSGLSFALQYFFQKKK